MPAEPVGGVEDSDVGGLRKVSRVVLLDPQDRILLLHGHEPDDPADDWWFTPGGGLEGDETREEAALRELAEETGITAADVELGPVLWRRTCSFPFAGAAGTRTSGTTWPVRTVRRPGPPGSRSWNGAVSPERAGGRARN